MCNIHSTINVIKRTHHYTLFFVFLKSLQIKSMKGVKIKFMTAHDPSKRTNKQYYFTDYINNVRHKWHVFAHNSEGKRGRQLGAMEVMSVG